MCLLTVPSVTVFAALCRATKQSNPSSLTRGDAAARVVLLLLLNVWCVVYVLPRMLCVRMRTNLVFVLTCSLGI